MKVNRIRKYRPLRTREARQAVVWIPIAFVLFVAFVTVIAWLGSLSSEAKDPFTMGLVIHYLSNIAGTIFMILLWAVGLAAGAMLLLGTGAAIRWVYFRIEDWIDEGE